jgi:hypothetical protein
VIHRPPEAITGRVASITAFQMPLNASGFDKIESIQQSAVGHQLWNAACGAPATSVLSQKSVEKHGFGQKWRRPPCLRAKAAPIACALLLYVKLARRPGGLRHWRDQAPKQLFNEFMTQDTS